MSATAAPRPTIDDVLRAVVARLEGDERAGQIEMARHVGEAMSSGTHLLVQAGTGTGKSLGYLVPAVLHDGRVVVATATLALQHQLVGRDIPALVEAASDVLGTKPAYAVLKGRRNYACLHRVREGIPSDQGTLVDVPEGTTGAQVVKLREWAEQEASRGGSGDRDTAPPHGEDVWQSVSVSHRECLGAARCPFGAECFAERARDRAFGSRLVVTNHALLAIDALDTATLPDYDVLIVDEAHELAGRVTRAATDELTAASIERAARRARQFLEHGESDDVEDSSDALRSALTDAAPGRVDAMPENLATAIELVRASARAAFSAMPKDSSFSDSDALRQQARAMLDEIRQTADRLATRSETDVIWVSEREPSRGGNAVCVAPLDVRGLIRAGLLADKTVIFTSATLKLGGEFDAIAVSVGLDPEERADSGPLSHDVGARIVRAGESQGARLSHVGDDRGTRIAHTDQDEGEQPKTGGSEDALIWRGVDVGSPFDYPRQAILYVARCLPTPGRDGIGSAQLGEIASLVDAAGGRTLGLFSSRRAAEVAAASVREALPHLPILCQGDGQLSHLQAEFMSNPAVSLFGTLSLWQGLDLPGETCQLVVIDRIPFPRPDDPLMSARARAAERAGRNGFMTVSATHAALLLAQGAGRLIRTASDRGVVAVLDPRLATARYGSFLRASLPPMWTTYDGAVARAALRRLSSAASIAPDLVRRTIGGPRPGEEL